MRSSYLYAGTGACMALLTAGLIWMNAATAPPDYTALVMESAVQASDTLIVSDGVSADMAVSSTPYKNKPLSAADMAAADTASAANTPGHPAPVSSAADGGASLPVLNAYPELEGIVIDLNHTNIEELDMLPNIGQKKAQAILDFVKENGPLDSVDRILEVKGIGEKTLETLRPYLTVS